MESIQVGEKINIRRSDGCIQSAIVGLNSIERQIVTVEWAQGTSVKGKEINWSAVLELNPSLAARRQQQVEKEKVPKVETRPHKTPTGYNMYSKKCPNSPYKKRQRPAPKCTSTPITGAKQVKPPAAGIAGRNPVKSNAVAGSFGLPCSNVVREVERLKEERERRRALQAEQRRKQSLLKGKDPKNPNWEVALMVRNYREQLQLNPLRSLTSHGSCVQQITVCVRKRPMSRREQQLKGVDIISVTSRDSLIVHELRNKVDTTKFLEHHKFRFDYTFDEQCGNALVYEHTARPLIRTIFEGGNATCFAYGQTGSGKTHTMGGEFCGRVQDSTSGIYAMAAQDVFAEMAKPKYREMGAQITCSYFEIYGAKVYDLLLPEKPLLRVLEDGRQQVVIVGLTKMPVKSVQDVLGLIERGNRERTSGQTSVNIKSSRSHAVFQMGLLLPDQWEPCGKCSFVDLAGNERGADTLSANLRTRREGAEINKSLLALKECIRAMSRHSSHLPFRGSKLTQVLRDSFIGGEQNKTCMIAMISPGLSSVENTLNTLRYADRVKELVAKEDPLDVISNVPAVDDQSDEEEKSAETETEADESADETIDFIDDTFSQTGQDTSLFNKSDSNLDMSECDGEAEDDGEDDTDEQNPQCILISEVVMQHDVLFEYFNNFKMNFEAVAAVSSSLKKKSRMSKFLLEVEPTLSELEALVKHTRNLVNSYNAQRYLANEQDSNADNLEN